MFLSRPAARTAPTSRSVPVEVTNGEFRIVFTSQVENPEINAIEIIPQTAGETSAATARSADTPTLKDAYKDHFYVGVAINRTIATEHRGPGRQRQPDHGTGQ